MFFFLSLLLAVRSFGWAGELHRVVFPDDATCNTPVTSVDGSNNTMVIDTSIRDPLTGSISSQEKLKLIQLLGQWEEPTRASDPRQVGKHNFDVLQILDFF